MKPVLLSIFGIPISSFGLFLLISFLTASLCLWRIIKVYELEEERSLDLLLLTFVGGLIGARIYFVLFHPNLFSDLTKAFLINKYPGLSFWGGLLGGILVLRFFCARFKINFWQMADFGLVCLFLGLFFGSLGCLLGTCQFGLPSTILAVPQVGLIDKRFPLQIIEGLIFLILFFYFWKINLKFHFSGEIAAKGLISLGLAKLSLEFLRGDRQLIYQNLSSGHLFSILLIISGISVYYTQSKRSALKDFKFILSLSQDQKRRNLLLSKLLRSWYNFKISWKVYLTNFKKNLLKMLNIKPNPTKF